MILVRNASIKLLRDRWNHIVAIIFDNGEHITQIIGKNPEISDGEHDYGDYGMDGTSWYVWRRSRRTKMS